MNSQLLQNLRLYAYHFGFRIKPEYLIPSQRFYRPHPTKMAPVVKVTPANSFRGNQEEIQAQADLALAKAHFEKRQTQKAQENLNKALLATTTSAKDLPTDLILEMYYLRGFLMMQKNKPRSAEMSFSIFLRLFSVYSKTNSAQSVRVKLEMVKIIMNRRKFKEMEPVISMILQILNDEADLEQTVLRAQCYQQLSEYHRDIGNWDTAIIHGKQSLQTLEASGLNTSDVVDLKRDLAKNFVQISQALVLVNRLTPVSSILEQTVKIVQDFSPQELQRDRQTMAFILSRLFNTLVRIKRNSPISYEIFQILQEADFQEKEFSKIDFIEYALFITEGLLGLQRYTEGSQLLKQISEDLDNYEVSNKTLGRYYYLNSQHEFENKNYQEALNDQRLFLETIPQQSFWVETGNLNFLSSYILGVKANIKLQRLDEAIEGAALFLEEWNKKVFYNNDLEDVAHTSLGHFLAENIKDPRWEKWLAEIKYKGGKTIDLKYGDLNWFVYLNLLILAAKSQNFSLAEDCAAIIKALDEKVIRFPIFTNPPYPLVHQLQSSTIIKDCIEIIENLNDEKYKDTLQLNTYVISLIELIPQFTRRKDLRGNIFILEEIEKIIGSYPFSLPLTVKLQLIKASLYSDLQDWSVVIGVLNEAIIHIERNAFQDPLIPIIYHLYGVALEKSGKQEEGEPYLQRAREIHKDMFNNKEGSFNRENLLVYERITDKKMESLSQEPQKENMKFG